MTEQELLQLWGSEKTIYDAWGHYVGETLMQAIGQAHKDGKNALKITPEPRLKEDNSLAEKAFKRGKTYTSPYNDITDKVGVRFVMLSTEDVAWVCNLVQKQGSWRWSQDKDFEADRAQRPEYFGYQSNHYIVRPQKPFEYQGTAIPIDIPCEIQVRSLLQHAWAEMSHDLVYKSKALETSPEALRLCARAVALTEIGDEIFCRVSQCTQEASKQVEDAKMNLEKLYAQIIQANVSPGKLNTFMVDAFSAVAEQDAIALIADLFKEQTGLVNRIQERAATDVLYRQPAILLVYYLANTKRNKTRELWPFTSDALDTIYADLGISF